MHSEQDLQRFFESLRMPAEQNGVGTLAEKRLHAALKRYYAPDSSCLEVPIGRYVADVFDGERIVEIQTRQFARLAGKLQFFLERYPTTVVYPMPRTRYLVWTDPFDIACSLRASILRRSGERLSTKRLPSRCESSCWTILHPN